jgi:hypothetical protein
MSMSIINYFLNSSTRAGALALVVICCDGTSAWTPSRHLVVASMDHIPIVCGSTNLEHHPRRTHAQPLRNML